MTMTTFCIMKKWTCPNPLATCQQVSGRSACTSIDPSQQKVGFYKIEFNVAVGRRTQCSSRHVKHASTWLYWTGAGPNIPKWSKIFLLIKKLLREYFSRGAFIWDSVDGLCGSWWARWTHLRASNWLYQTGITSAMCQNAQLNKIFLFD